jgi:pimeloyl-ACP methyl ester carboxylesterase
VAFDADHFLHTDQPEASAAAVRAFLNELRR